ncbi:MAG: hypothetical protein ABW123_17055 [Cystobacter sp.]
MSGTSALETFELAILQLVAQGKGEWRWHNVASQLSSRGLMGSYNLIHVFKDMMTKGWVRETATPDHPHPKWDITERGQEVLKTRAVTDVSA